MKHKVKKIKFYAGQDSDQMLVRKLLSNFFVNGKISTTIKKIKMLRPQVERIVTKIKSNSQSDKNMILRKLGDGKIKLDNIFKEIATQLKDVTGGYTKIIKTGYRDSDGAPTGTLIWAHTVVMPPATEKKSKKVKKSAGKQEKEVKK